MVGEDGKDVLLRDFADAEGHRKNWEDLWQQIAWLVMPRRDFTNQMARGERRHRRIYDSTALQGNERFSGNLYGFLTNPAIKWFDLAMEEDELNHSERVREWLFRVRDIILAVLNEPSKGFPTNTHELYLELGAFGSSGMFIGQGLQGIRFETRPLGELFIREDHMGKVDSVYRKFEFTARQARQFYGEDKLPQPVLKELDRQPGRLFTFMNAIVPREDRRIGSYSAQDKPWASCHYLMQTKQKIMEGGFDDMPYLFPRWSMVPGEVYGRSPAMTALSDIMMLQEMSKTVIRSAQKMVDPPLMIPDDGFLNPPRTIPGGFNYYRASTKNRIEPLETRGRPDIGLEMMDQRRDAVLKAFFLDLASLREADRMTATEVIERRENRFRLMSPQIARLQAEFLSPLIDRVFNLLLRAGELPEPPGEIQGERIKVEFISPAALAMRTTEADNYVRWLSIITPVMQIDPTAAANVDMDEFIRSTAKLYNIPPRLLTAEGTAQRVREAQAQQEQAMAAAETAATAGQAAKNFGDGAEAVKEVMGAEQV